MRPGVRNKDIFRLEEAGYLIEIHNAHLVVKGVPFVAADGAVRHGRIISAVDPNAAGGTVPSSHQIWFHGGAPHGFDGAPIDKWSITAGAGIVAPGLQFDFQFSMKLINPETKTPRDYIDEVEKITTYHRVIAGPARHKNKEAAETLPPDIEQESTPFESPFVYPDTASARAGVVMINHKLHGLKIGIIGVGGTGSYVLDLVAKSPVAEIRLYDGDTFDSHNAYRSPGAASLEAVTADLKKVDYFASIYRKIHKNIAAVPNYVGEENVAELADLDFAFICMDTGPAKRTIIEFLENSAIQFIDTGMNVRVVEGEISGLVRVTTSSRFLGDVIGRDRLSFRPQERDDPYNQNIQLGDLNALNAALAVLKWKKLYDVYVDARMEHHATFVIESSGLTSKDRYEV